MAAITTALAIGGLALAGAGTYMQFKGQKDAQAAQQQSLQLQQAQEAERQKAMELDATRRKREIVRQGVAARSQSLTVASSQGAQLGSALPGAYGGIAAKSGNSVQGVDQNLQIGRTMFGLNSQQNLAQQAYAKAQSYTGFGQGLTSLGGALIKNMEAFSKVGTYVSSFGTNTSAGAVY